jgi:nickel-dependent lactate racemase
MLYGSVIIDYFIPKALKQVKILKPSPFTRDFVDLDVKFHELLENPLGMDVSFHKLISQVYEVGKRITVIVDDHTRANVHTKLLLPMLLRELASYEVRNDDVRILIATGTHRAPTEDELERGILGPKVYAQWRNHVLIHKCDEDCGVLGETSQKTPVYLNSSIIHSCLVIPLTDSEYHYFAGQAGTVKSLCPGVAGRETVRRNHPKMFDLDRGFKPDCRLGNTLNNPVIQEIREIAEMVKKETPIFGIDSIVINGEIVYLHGGDIIALHDAACGPLRELSVVEVDKPADLVFVSPGELGLNLYQACKGVHAGWNAVRKDGRGLIVILAPCRDGVGNKSFYQAMYECGDKSVRDGLRYVLDNYCTEEVFQIGNQKPVDLLRILITLGEGNLKIYSEMDSKELTKVFRMDAIPRLRGKTAQETLRRTVQEYLKINPNPIIYILQDAGILVKAPENLKDSQPP